MLPWYKGDGKEMGKTCLIKKNQTYTSLVSYFDSRSPNQERVNKFDIKIS